jgi:hypothetical protein
VEEIFGVEITVTQVLLRGRVPQGKSHNKAMFGLK